MHRAGMLVKVVVCVLICVALVWAELSGTPVCTTNAEDDFEAQAEALGGETRRYKSRS